MTSSTGRVGSIRVRTVTPSLVVTLLLGTKPARAWAVVPFPLVGGVGVRAAGFDDPSPLADMSGQERNVQGVVGLEIRDVC